MYAECQRIKQTRLMKFLTLVGKKRLKALQKPTSAAKRSLSSAQRSARWWTYSPTRRFP